MLYSSFFWQFQEFPSDDIIPHAVSSPHAMVSDDAPVVVIEESPPKDDGRGRWDWECDINLAENLSHTYLAVRNVCFFERKRPLIEGVLGITL